MHLLLFLRLRLNSTGMVRKATSTDVLSAFVIVTWQLTVLLPSARACDFDQKLPHERTPCTHWRMPLASDNRPGFEVHLANGQLPWQLQPEVNDSSGNAIGELLSCFLQLRLRLRNGFKKPCCVRHLSVSLKSYPTRDELTTIVSLPSWPSGILVGRRFAFWQRRCSSIASPPWTRTPQVVSHWDLDTSPTLINPPAVCKWWLSKTAQLVSKNM